ncbi:MAG: dihydrofolate reductase [Planctomycetota bacterium]
MSTIILIAAMSSNRAIGRDNDLPWRLRDDLGRFMRRTKGHPVIMGRLTWESMDGQPLPGRRNIVLTSRSDYRADGAEIAPTLDVALALTSEADEVFVIGGENVFREALPLADSMELTHVDAVVDGDAHFPDFDASAWTVTAEEQHRADARNEYDFTVRIYERRA